ncbi:polycomb group RING finger protein 1-like [Convolutriloba macropyga]|uniref:polycomb group RING finger protein 1-like n=1 Tax=Convolutriloba macropyga TaxID=536237 RepID=UPI003F5215B1
MKVTSVKLTEINPHIICPLCNGYLINATTTIDCLHTFCKSCIYNYLQTQTSDNKKCCPICETFLNRSKPSESLRPDPVLQNIVYSVVPNLYSLERERKTRFYEGEKMRQTILSSPNPSLDAIFGPEKPDYFTSENKSKYKLSLHYLISEKNSSRVIPVSSFKVPYQVKLADLEQILRIKFGLNDNNFVEFYYSAESDCVKKYLNMEEIYKIMENNGLISVFEPPTADNEEVKEFDIFYRIYAIKRKKRQRSRSSSDAETEKKKKPTKPKSDSSSTKPKASSNSTKPKISTNTADKKNQSEKSSTSNKTTEETNTTRVNKPSTTEPSKFSINSLLENKC